MKNTIDQAAVAAIATAALLAESDSDLDPDCRFPEQIATALLWGKFYDGGSIGDNQRALTAFDRTFAFALQLGARIGSDPLQRPDIRDLVEKYHFDRKVAPGEAA